jgi:outer membrane lipoprotein SlyB
MNLFLILGGCASIATILGVIYSIQHQKKQTEILTSESEIKKENESKQNDFLSKAIAIEGKKCAPIFAIDTFNDVVYDGNSKIATITLINTGHEAQIQSINPILGKIVNSSLNSIITKGDTLSISIKEDNSGYKFSVKYSDKLQNQHEITISGKGVIQPNIQTQSVTQITKQS